MTPENDQASRAARFRDLHRGTVLVLPNAWDAGSACVIEAAGALAIATTSAGVSWALGAPDSQGLNRQQMDPPGSDIYLRVAEGGSNPPDNLRVVFEWTATHWGTQVLTVRDPDGRLFRLEAPHED
jgi:Phosphoenolpyruvate phosphomutase